MKSQMAISGMAKPMLIWITTRSMSVPWLKISLRISLSKTGLARSSKKVAALGRGEEPVGKLIAADHQPDRLLRFGLHVDDILSFAAHVGRVEQPRGGADEQEPRRRPRPAEGRS